MFALSIFGSIQSAVPSVDPAPVVMVVPPRADTDLGPGFLGIMRHLLSDDDVIEPEAPSTPLAPAPGVVSPFTPTVANDTSPCEFTPMVADGTPESEVEVFSALGAAGSGPDLLGDSLSPHLGSAEELLDLHANTSRHHQGAPRQHPSSGRTPAATIMGAPRQDQSLGSTGEHPGSIRHPPGRALAASNTGEHLGRQQSTQEELLELLGSGGSGCATGEELPPIGQVHTIGEHLGSCDRQDDDTWGFLNGGCDGPSVDPRIYAGMCDDEWGESDWQAHPRQDGGTFDTLGNEICQGQWKGPLAGRSRSPVRQPLLPSTAMAGSSHMGAMGLSVGGGFRAALARQGQGRRHAVHVFCMHGAMDSDRAYEHARARVRAVANAGRAFYLGITENPDRRFGEHLGTNPGWAYMTVLLQAPSSRHTAALEMRLLVTYGPSLQCLNKSSGGERASCGTPHYLYMLVADNGLIRHPRAQLESAQW